MNLFLRLASAAVLLPIVIWLFAMGGWYLDGMIVVVTGIALFEYGRIVERDDMFARVLLFVLGMTATIAAMFVDAQKTLMVFQVCVLVVPVLYTLRPGDVPTAWRRMCTLSFGILYVGLGFSSMEKLRELGDTVLVDGHTLTGSARMGFLLAALTATWANDTCAYFAGRAFGKHKLAPLLSPKKTWEGFAGGFVGTLSFLFAGKALFPETFAGLTSTDLVILGVPSAFLGPVGDLAESLLKRNYDVKDSGNILPGHGGMLDRIDAAFFVCPWVLCYLVALKPLLH